MALVLDYLRTSTALVSATYRSAKLPQPLLRDRRTMRVPRRAIGAGIEAASIGARTGTFIRRVAMLGLDLDLIGCYALANALGGIQDFLTRVVTAHHLSAARSLAALADTVRHAVRLGLLDHPEIWRSLAFLAKVRPADDVLTAHIELFGMEATLTTSIVEGSLGFWTTGFDLAAAVMEDLDRGGDGRVPQIVEAWTFTFGPRLRGLHPVTLLSEATR